MSAAVAAVLGLLCPTRCVSCGTPGAPACPSCLADLCSPPRRVTPSPCPAGFPPTFAVAGYAGACRDLLLAYKEREAIGLSRPLALPLAAAVTAVVRAAGVQGFVIVPVPSSGAAIRQRGDDVVRLLARRAARLVPRALGPARVVPALRQVRPVADSAGLGAVSRLLNLNDALAVRPGAAGLIVGRPVVLVDDLVTTGATLVEASRAVRAAGGSVVGAATVAATRRRLR